MRSVTKRSHRQVGLAKRSPRLAEPQGDEDSEEASGVRRRKNSRPIFSAMEEYKYDPRD
jgi:hypothetical protein